MGAAQLTPGQQGRPSAWWVPAHPICRQLAEVVQARYLSGPERAKRHGVLADFFLGTWSQGTKKLITLPLLGKPLNLDRKVSMAAASGKIRAATEISCRESGTNIPGKGSLGLSAASAW